MLDDTTQIDVPLHAMLKAADIRALREKLKLSQEQLAELAGTSQQNVERIESGKVQHSRFLPRIVEVLSGLESGQKTTNHPLKPASEAVLNVNPPPDLFGERDLPVFAAVEGGPGEMVVDNEPFDYVLRPWFLRSSSHAFAILIVGESMIPEFRPGRMAIVDKKMPLVPGEPAIFVNQRDGGFKATIKELVKTTATHWHVKQHNPPEGQKAEFKISREEWPEAWRVVAAYFR